MSQYSPTTSPSLPWRFQKPTPSNFPTAPLGNLFAPFPLALQKGLKATVHFSCDASLNRNFTALASPGFREPKLREDGISAVQGRQEEEGGGS